MKRSPNEEECKDCPAFPEKECLDDNIVTLSVFQACGDPELRLRLMEMGFVRDTEVKVVKYAPLNDPMEFVVKGYHITLRREEADNVLMNAPGKAA
jgi:ferrous iron transport protein A